MSNRVQEQVAHGPLAEWRFAFATKAGWIHAGHGILEALLHLGRPSRQGGRGTRGGKLGVARSGDRPPCEPANDVILRGTERVRDEHKQRVRRWRGRLPVDASFSSPSSSFTMPSSSRKSRPRNDSISADAINARG
jgi:hypothetical protein